MNITGVILVATLAILSVVLFAVFISKMKKIQELKKKMDFALNGEELMKIELSNDKLLGEVAENFNALAKKYQKIKADTNFVNAENADKQKLGVKIKDIEQALYQLTALTDIGKQITSSLDVDEILKNMYQFVRSSMNVEEIELMYFINDETYYKTIGKSNTINNYTGQQFPNETDLMKWSLKNDKEIFLNDVQADYGQYVFNPVVSFSKKFPMSLICLPLSLHKKEIGSIAIYSMQKDTYTSYHLDLMRTLASYLAVAIDNSNVYSILNSNKKVIEIEKEKSDKLLLNILPLEVADELKQKGYADAKQFDNVSVLFTDFVNFTGISEKLTPRELVHEINYCFSGFDQIMERNGMEKIKTIGDAYLAVCGLPIENPNHAINTIKTAKEIIEFIAKRKSGGGLFDIRVGVHSGSVVAGIVGIKKYAYDIWGDTVNTAARMESSSESGKINISGTTYELIKNDFKTFHRGKIKVKNKGEIDMYFIE